MKCEVCGNRMVEVQCALLCPRCGNRLECTDFTIPQIIPKKKK